MGSHHGHPAADLMLKTCAASAAQLQVSTDPAQKMCAATTCNILPADFLQVKNNKGLSWAEKNGGSRWNFLAQDPRTVTVLSIKEKHRSSDCFAKVHDNELLSRSLLQEIMLLVAHAATFPDLQAVCNTPLQGIRRSVRYTV